MPRIWNNLPILHLNEPLVDFPNELSCFNPHPYVSLGAPYGPSSSPWRLRGTVLNRLLNAQLLLKSINPSHSFLVFDAWRPIRVQSFMYQKAFEDECLSRGIDPKSHDLSDQILIIKREVSKYWAPPSLNPGSPPPHSTGSAVDLTLSVGLTPLDMGGEIDFIGEKSKPNFYSDHSSIKKDSNESIWHFRRTLLSTVMSKYGFVQHPNEWWHFSFGDQFWAWKTGRKKAFYGSIDNNLLTSSSPIALI